MGAAPRTRTLGPSHPGLAPAPSHPRTFAPSHPCRSCLVARSFELRSSFTRDAYLEAVQRVREYIFAGDIFQANLSQRFEADSRESAWSFYTRLRQRNAAPFAAFLDFPEVVGRERIAGALSPCRCERARRDASDQGHAAARSRSRTRRRARTGAGRERQGSRREPDDRRPDAQRSVARVRAALGARVGALLARALRDRASPRLDGRRRA